MGMTARQALPALAAFMIAVLPAAAATGAWTLPAGEVNLRTTYTYTDAVDALDNDGKRDVSADFYMHGLSILIEYGALDYLTAYVEPNVRWIDAAGVRESGHSHTDVGLRLRLLGQDDEVFSVQAEVTFPGDIDGIPDVLLNQGETEYEFRALYGASFDLGGIPAFFNAEGGYRIRDGGPADEWHGDFAFGWQPQRATEVLIESLNVWAEGEGDDPLLYPYYRQHKLQGSLLMHASPEFTLQIGGFYTWDGQNVLAEDGGFISGQYSF